MQTLKALFLSGDELDCLVRCCVGYLCLEQISGYCIQINMISEQISKEIKSDSSFITI